MASRLESIGWSSSSGPQDLAPGPAAWCALCEALLSARSGWAWSDRRSGSVRRARGPARCSGSDPFVRAGQPEHRELAPRRPMIWRPTGRPSDSPAGIDTPGRPAMLTGRVQASDRYIATGSSSLAPDREGDGRAGRRADRVEAGRPDRVEVRLDQRPHLLSLQVVRVVVAGRQGVGAEHDPALDLRPEARASGAEVVGDVRRRARSSIAVVDAVVAGEVRRCLGRGDDVVRGEAVVRVRQRDFLDVRTGRLQWPRRPRGRERPRPAPCPSTKYSRGSASRRPFRYEAASSSPAGRFRSSSRHRHRRRGRVAFVATGDGVQEDGRIAGVAGERARSGRG